MIRKEALVTGQTYHIFNRSIAKFVIHNHARDYQRTIETLAHYSGPFWRGLKLSRCKQYPSVLSRAAKYANPANKPPVKVVAYCLMPTHYHLVLEQLRDHGISQFVGLVQNSYAKYFNIKHKRYGPLWAGRFKNVRIEDDELLLHLTRYVHLNPTTGNLARRPEDWDYSSYRQFIGLNSKSPRLTCNYEASLSIDPAHYQGFVDDRKDYQKELKNIQYLLLDED